MINYKIIQVVENYGSSECLKYRLHSFPEVHKFLIIGLIEPEILESHKDKIIYEKIENKNSENIHKIISEKLFSICDNSEDIIILSKNEEFFDFSKISKIKEELSYGPTYVNHIPLWWGKNYRQRENSLGSAVFSFFHLITNPNLIYLILNKKPTSSNFSVYSEINGWSLNGIFDSDDGDIHFKQSLHPRNNFYEKLVCTTMDTLLPPKPELIPDYVDKKTENILVLVDNDSEIEDYDKIIKISFSQNKCDSLRISKDLKNYNFEILIPNQVYYGTSKFEDFIKKFKDMEINKIINLVRCSGDTITIKNPS